MRRHDYIRNTLWVFFLILILTSRPVHACFVNVTLNVEHYEMMSGGYTDPPALAYANNSTGSDAPAVAYSTVYPLTMFLRVVAAQALVLCFM